jgi:hypothetical protein
MKNDPTTYFERASAEADENRGGRFAALAQATVIGTSPQVQYPRGPNWTADPVPPEAPLGFEVDAIEPVGTANEIERSLRQPAAAVEAASVGSPIRERA